MVVRPRPFCNVKNSVFGEILFPKAVFDKFGN